MSRHAVYGLVVESEFALGSLPEACDATAPADIRVVRAPPGHFDVQTLEPRVARQSCASWYRHATLVDGGILFAVPGVLEAEVSADGRTAVCAPAPDGDRRAFEANLLTFVVSIALTLKGEEPLHATVVRLLDGRAIGFLGDSGSGKSTLAAFLLGQGAELVTDDILRVGFVGERPVVHRGPARLKLFDGEARLLLPGAARQASFNPMSGKLLVEPTPSVPSVDSSPFLAALFWLGEAAPTDCGGRIAVRRIGGMEAIRTLLATTLHRDYRSPERGGRQLQAVERLARTVPLFALGYERRHEMLPDVAAELAAVVAT